MFHPFPLVCGCVAVVVMAVAVVVAVVGVAVLVVAEFACVAPAPLVQCHANENALHTMRTHGTTLFTTQQEVYTVLLHTCA